MKNEEGSHLVVLSVMLAHFDALQEKVVFRVRDGRGHARLSAVFLHACPPRLVSDRGTESVVRTSQQEEALLVRVCGGKALLLLQSDAGAWRRVPRHADDAVEDLLLRFILPPPPDSSS